MRSPRPIQEKKKGRTREPFAMIPFKWLKLPAWEHLNGNAVKLLLHLWSMSGGDNGAHGDRDGLFLSEREAALALGIARNTASAAFELLIEAGWLRPVQKGHFAVKAGEQQLRATVWRLTFQSYPQGRLGPTGEYLRWQPEEISRDQKLNGSGSKIEPVAPNEGGTGAIIDPVADAALSEPPISTRSIIEPHIDIAKGKRDSGGCENSNRPPEIAGGPISADPLAAVRARVGSYCERVGKDGTAQMARRLGLDPAEVRGFAQGRANLDPKKLAALRTATKVAA
jgi:hypothetical protein